MSSTDIISVKLCGGLANRIFQVLAAVSYAKKNRKQLILCKENNEENPHEKDTDIYIHKLFPEIINETEKITYNHTFDYTKKPFIYVNIPGVKGNVLLTGYFQSVKYFPSDVPNISTTYYQNTYFIHIRAGDYINNPYHFICLKEYYRKCINMLRIKDPLSKFLVFSNDTLYAKDYIDQYNIEYTISDITIAYYTLIEMANCAGGICANSSFSWLGGYFQKDHRGIICMPSKWLTDTTPTDDLYPSWATIVNV